jgi:ubiquinone/menaquinone biosynthesis C-methylase UbiE
MRRGRRAYYDKFSRFYDRFVALHSRDRQGLARKLLVDQIPVQNAGSVLDLCTGTVRFSPTCRQRSDLMAKLLAWIFPMAC